MVGGDQIASFSRNFVFPRDLISHDAEKSHHADEQGEKVAHEPPREPAAAVYAGNRDANQGEHHNPADEPAEPEQAEADSGPHESPGPAEFGIEHQPAPSEIESLVRRPQRCPDVAYSVATMPQTSGLSRPEIRRRASRFARQILISMLADMTGSSEAEWTISPPDRSSPCVVSHPASIDPPRISLSHDERLIACCACWQGRVGIDLQHERSVDRLAAIGSFLGWPDGLLAAADANTLTRAWATWEASAKAWGCSVLGPVPGFVECLDAMDRPDGRLLCMTERWGSAWLVVACPDLQVQHSRIARWLGAPE